MAELEINNPEFEINISLQGASKTIRIQPQETSDGVPYYSCYEGAEQLTQIRLDEDGKWEQLWGELEQEEIDLIGKQIEDKV